MSVEHLFTSESVSEGHPDKIADQISDGVLDEVLRQDSKGRVACETLVTTGLVLVAGEMSTEAYVDVPKVARETVKKIGYDRSSLGFDWETCAVITSIDEQSPDISMGVDTGGAGDQGLMFGYATNETKQYMPMPIQFAHEIVKRMADLRRSGEIPFLRPDSKSQVTIRYVDDRPVELHTVVVSSQHDPGVSRERIREEIIEKVVRPCVPEGLGVPDSVLYHVNPTGSFVRGGPHADCGLTGRKIIVDTYGGMGRHGGGAFSGKDPTKVDRSACYAARHIAKNIVASGLAERCEVQLAYAIGVVQPVSIMVDTYGTGKIDENRLERIIRERWDLSPKGIIETFKLRRPIYRKTAAYGHFGREEEEFTWESLSHVEELKNAV